MSVSKIASSYKFLSWGLAGFLLFLIYGCEMGDAFNLYEDYELEIAPQPVIHEVDPPDSYLAGVDKITIMGENFHPDTEMNRVFFNDNEGMVLSGNEEMLEVRPADEVGDSVMIRVEVRDSDKFSEKYAYQLESAYDRLEGLRGVDQPFGLTVDPEGNVYFSNATPEGNQGIVKLNPETGEREVIVDQTNWRYIALAYGPDDKVYMSRAGDLSLIYRDDGNSGEQVFYFGERGRQFNDLTFDSQGYLWAAGLNEGGDFDDLLRVDEEGNEELFRFNADVGALAYRDGYLYAGGRMAGESGIWRFDLSSNHMAGQRELYFDFGTQTGEDPLITALNFTSEGKLFVGTDGSMPVVLIDEQATDWQEFYPGIVHGETYAMAWLPESDKLLQTRIPPQDSDYSQTLLWIRTQLEPS